MKKLLLLLCLMSTNLYSFPAGKPANLAIKIAPAPSKEVQEEFPVLKIYWNSGNGWEDSFYVKWGETHTINDIYVGDTWLELDSELRTSNGKTYEHSCTTEKPHSCFYNIKAGETKHAVITYYPV